MLKPIAKLSFIALLFVSTLPDLQAQQGVVTINQDKDIDKLLEFKKDLATVNAFTIQIFSGSSRSARSDAQAIKTQVTTLFPDWANFIEYEQPNYKIRVGNFRTRLEADRALITVKKSYANAFILQPKKS
ncbi:MAG TPA: SPOR domain-containing protein [Gelidibacter sp.]|uniref:SPOR domain-containing protein n=1 Tax=Gelidibacter sp. TaxID=2018083 RepID=UPI002C1D6CE4|nr:SPOR domain-containing protein [Gelidibacter sp.]HXJ98831.1 SPOR domain-containing protein [Gelidibacter sp.]